LIVAALSFYWLVYEPPPLHAENRYYLRTALVVLTPVFAGLAVLSAAPANDAPPPLARLSRIARSALVTPGIVAFASAALFLATLIHSVETLRFVIAWTAYTDEIGQLASQPASASQDSGPFVSSQRVSARLQPLAWSSTTPFLSVLVAPNLNPSRLVVDPTAGYFWLSCSLSAQNETAGKAIPKPALALRPLKMSVTEIEHWLRDPYTIYAKHILRLLPLDPVDMPLTAADRGSRRPARTAPRSRRARRCGC